MKRVVILSGYFKPEFTGIAPHASGLADELILKGHKVDVFAPMPFYPDWNIWLEYKGKLFTQENLEGVRVFRNWLYVPSSKGKITVIRRMIHEASFVTLQAMNFLLHISIILKADRVIVFSPPFLQSVNALILSLFLRKKVIFHVEDIQPDSAADLGMIRSGFVGRVMLWLLRSLERAIYKYSYRVSTLTHGMADNIRGKLGKSDKKVFLLPYWVDFEIFLKNIVAARRFRQKMNFSKDSLIIGYAGNLGRKQQLHHLLRLSSMHSLDKRVKVIIAGAGAEKSKLMALKEELKLTNVQMIPLLKGQDYVDFLNGVHISYLSQDESADNIFIPSKLFTTLSCGSPVLCIAGNDSELARTVMTTGAGYIFTFGELSETILLLNSLARDQQKLEQLSEQAVSFSRAHYDKNRIIADFLGSIGF
jgi:colanic acid biosynthesis glycosyl transferase WcaI